MKIASIILALGLSISSGIGSVLLDFAEETSYTEHFSKATAGGTIAWNPSGSIQASGGNVPVATQYLGETTLTDSISMTFTVGAAQTGQFGIYTRIREDGGAILGYVQMGRSGISANGNYFNLMLNYGGANMVLNGATSTNFFDSGTQYLHRYITPGEDLFTLTLNQRQEGTLAQFELVLSINGVVLASTGFHTPTAATAFNNEGASALYFRPNTLSTIDVTSFSVIPEPATVALLGFSGLAFLGLSLRRSALRS